MKPVVPRSSVGRESRAPGVERFANNERDLARAPFGATRGQIKIFDAVGDDSNDQSANREPARQQKEDCVRQSEQKPAPSHAPFRFFRKRRAEFYRMPIK